MTLWTLDLSQPQTIKRLRINYLHSLTTHFLICAVKDWTTWPSYFGGSRQQAKEREKGHALGIPEKCLLLSMGRNWYSFGPITSRPCSAVGNSSSRVHSGFPGWLPVQVFPSQSPVSTFLKETEWTTHRDHDTLIWAHDTLWARNWSHKFCKVLHFCCKREDDNMDYIP